MVRIEFVRCLCPDFPSVIFELIQREMAYVNDLENIIPVCAKAN